MCSIFHVFVQEMTANGGMVTGLFDANFANITRLPPDSAARAIQEGPSGRVRVVADYVAGMTDRFASRGTSMLPVMMTRPEGAASDV